MTIRALHKWLSLIIGIQVLIWVLSGSIISWLDHETVGGRSTFKPLPPATTIGQVGQLFDVTQLALPEKAELASVELSHTAGKLSYHITTSLGLNVFDASTGKALHISEQTAQITAINSYRGDGVWLSNEFLSNGADELTAKHGDTPQWRIRFDDAIHTRVYISAIDGRVLAHRNHYSQLVDFLLMLHFMDYADEHGFNNLQIRLVGFAALWLSISGLLLVQSSFSRRDFTLKGIRK